MEKSENDCQEYVTGLPDSGSSIWISKRINPNKSMFNKFGTIGGKVEPDETQEQTLRREALEEAGVDIQELYYLNTKEYTKKEEYLPKRRIVHTYIIKINQVPERREPQNMGEWQQIKWKELKESPILGSLEEYYKFRKREQELYQGFIVSGKRTELLEHPKGL